MEACQKFTTAMNVLGYQPGELLLYSLKSRAAIVILVWYLNVA